MTMSKHYTVWKRSSSTQRSDTKVMLFKALFGAIKPREQGVRGNCGYSELWSGWCSTS